MNRYVSPLNNGGVPILGTDILNTESELYDVFISIIQGQMSPRAYSSYTSFESGGITFNRFSDSNDNGVILSGIYADSGEIQFTDLAQTGTFSISEGYVFLEDEICYYPGATFSPIGAGNALWVVKDTVSYTNRKHADGTTKQTRVTTNATITETSYSSPPTGPYVLLAYAYDVGAPYWNSQDLGYIARLDNDVNNNFLAISNVQSNLNNIANKETTTLSIDNPSDWSVVSPHNLKLTRFADTSDIVYCQGVISHTSASFTDIATIPSGWRPASYNGSNFAHSVASNDTDPTNHQIHISSGGVITGSIDSGYTMTINTWWVTSS